MKLQNMFKKTRKRNRHVSNHSHPEVPEGLLRKCNKCNAVIMTEDVENGGYICPQCQGYFRMPSGKRLESILDAGSFEEWDRGMTVCNPLHFKGYEEKLCSLREKTGLEEAVVTGKGTIQGHSAVVGVCDGRFLMASMGKVAGEKITRAVERATEEKLPIVLFACSGGARMQEGIVSLMQMAKTSAALKRHSDAGLLYISVLTDPTMGGVTASFAMLGDLILAEPGARIGFAGPRVIEQTIGEKLPKGFQRAEFLLEHGFVDRIVERKEMKTVLGQILQMHRSPLQDGKEIQEKTEPFEMEEMRGIQKNQKTQKTQKIQKKEKQKCVGNRREDSMEQGAGNAWNRVCISRKKDRPAGSDYLTGLFPDFLELHGDRVFEDDAAVIGGLAVFHGKPVTVIAQAKGKSTRENVKRHFGMPSPGGYRKALRLMKQAEKFHRPVLCFVDTPGAFCGLEAEERGQGEAIARNLFELSSLKTPVLSVVIGEGGSGGALAMALADEVWMLENAIYSILSPEGFASILWKDSKRAEEAAEVMKLTAFDLKELGMIEQIIPEPEEFTADTMGEVCKILDLKIDEFLKKQEVLSPGELAERRYERFRRM
ncbi:MAG: acetyl-CoA carboxylase carboxyltransferase subunit beta [Ruminococcus sp.]|nr:acetyl-CoA carboxylase carboxyltransferase subunit beta [Ruminococcus sp.]